jgi:hypothetical protein
MLSGRRRRRKRRKEGRKGRRKGEWEVKGRRQWNI